MAPPALGMGGAVDRGAQKWTTGNGQAHSFQQPFTNHQNSRWQMGSEEAENPGLCVKTQLIFHF